MSNVDLAPVIFDRWCAEFVDMQKTKEYYYDNFYVLFFDMKRGHVEMDVAHGYIRKAVTHHMPNSKTLTHVYKRSKSITSRMTEREFEKEWRQLMSDKALAAFYDIYDYELDDEEQLPPLPNGMSREEYNLQRRHAESFPIIDVSKIDDLHKMAIEYDGFTLEDLEKRYGRASSGADKSDA